MADDSGWGDALTATIKILARHPALPQWRRTSLGALTDEQARTVLAWRSQASRLLGYSRHLDEQLDKLLDSAARHLETQQAQWAAHWAAITSASWWEDAPQCDRDLFAAITALSRTAGLEVMLTDRVAVDLIESMTGRCWVFGKDRPGITRAKRRLQKRGCFTIRFMPGSKTTIYCLVLQGFIPVEAHTSPVALAEAAADTRPLMAEQDERVVLHSRTWLREGRKWVPGRAVAVVRSLLEEHAEAETRQLASIAGLEKLLDPGTDTDFSMLAGGDVAPDPGNRRRDDAAAGG